MVKITTPLSFEQKLDKIVEKALDDKKAQDIVSISLSNKSDIADFMVVATGTSSTHIGALAKYVVKALAAEGIHILSVEGTPNNEWVLIDTPYIIIHLFQPQFRSYYNLEKMWMGDFSSSQQLEHVY